MKKIFFIALTMSTILITGCGKSEKIILNTPEGTIKVKHIEENKIYSIAKGVDYYSYKDKDGNNKYYLYINNEINNMNSNETLIAILNHFTNYSNENISYYLDNYESENINKIHNAINNNEKYIYCGYNILGTDDYNNLYFASIERAIGTSLPKEEKEKLIIIRDSKDSNYNKEILDSYKQDLDLKYVIANYSDHNFENDKDVWGNTKVNSNGDTIKVRTTLKNNSSLTNCEVVRNELDYNITIQEYNVKVKAGEKIKFISYYGPQGFLKARILGAPTGYGYTLAKEVERNGNVVKYESEVFKEDVDVTIRVEQHKSKDLGYSIWI